MRSIWLSVFSRKKSGFFQDTDRMLVTNKWEVVGIFLSVELFEKLSKDWTIGNDQEISKTSEPKKAARILTASGVYIPAPVARDPNKKPEIIEIDWTKVPEIDGPDGWPMPNPEYIPPEQRIEE